MGVDIRPLAESDLAMADRIFRQAFGTFLGLPDPLAFGGDADYVRTRWQAAPDASIGAFLDGELVGSNFIAHWGSFGFFGPLTVRPDLWDRGIARQLLDQAMAIFSQRDIRQLALYTFPHSTKHIGLYQKYGFWPQQLTAVMAKVPEPPYPGAAPILMSGLPAPAREEAAAACFRLTDAVFPGLDLRREIAAVAAQSLGETVLLQQDDGLEGFAVCHIGAGTEAGSGCLYLKFGAAWPGEGAAGRFDRLLQACEVLAASRGLGRVMAGVNTARHAAYRGLLARGYRAALQGVAMQRDNLPGFNRADCFVVDDWR